MKTILFTGARSGIINKVIDNIIDKNFKIYVTVHTMSELKRIKEKYKNNKNIMCFKLDVTSKKDREKLKNMKIDILVSNAACGYSGSMAEIDMNKVRNNFETNVFSNFEIIQLVLKNMLKKEQGKIIIMGSLAGLVPMPFLGSYSATKASIIKMTESLNLELKLLKKNITISLILPGLYNTGFNKMMFDKKYDDMDINSYFKNQINMIRKTENLVLKLFQKNNLSSITKKITKAIINEKPKFTYKAPFAQVIAVKLYNLFM
ncbi:MAG: SDR family NAD(P)-dependent oxidoreductase [Bacilli bacterium]|nr:SDR family NAD(P)-dependent oxidoreductase [Bacilli bacterium]